MGFLGTTELANLRSHMSATLPGTCTIQYVTNAASSIGSIEATWTSRGTAIACRLAPITARALGLTAEQVNEGRYWMLSLAYDQTVTVTDRVTIGDDTYQVLQVNAGESEVLLKRVLLELAQ